MTSALLTGSAPQTLGLFPDGFLLIRQGLLESRKVLKSADLNVDPG